MNETLRNKIIDASLAVKRARHALERAEAELDEVVLEAALEHATAPNSPFAGIAAGAQAVIAKQGARLTIERTPVPEPVNDDPHQPFVPETVHDIA